jgi:hypothetical protein
VVFLPPPLPYLELQLTREENQWNAIVLKVPWRLPAKPCPHYNMNDILAMNDYLQISMTMKRSLL